MNPKKESSFDVMAYLRKPQGITIVVILMGIIAWGAWTVWASRV
jgi:hypothetical protein